MISDIQAQTVYTAVVEMLSEGFVISTSFVVYLKFI